MKRCSDILVPLQSGRGHMEFQLIPFGLTKVLHTGNSYPCSRSIEIGNEQYLSRLANNSESRAGKYLKALLKVHSPFSSLSRLGINRSLSKRAGSPVFQGGAVGETTGEAI